LAASAGTTPVVLSEEDCVRDQLGYLPSNYVGVSAWKKPSKGVGGLHRTGVQISSTLANATTFLRENGTDAAIGIPVAIQTYPLNGGAKRRQNKARLHDNESGHDDETSKTSNQPTIVQSPFPTLFWLTCPDISRAVAQLEGRGFVQLFEDRLNAHPELAMRLFACHEEYAQLRWRSLTDRDRNILTGSLSSSSSSSSALQRMRNMMECSGISGTNFTDIASWDRDYADQLTTASSHKTDGTGDAPPPKASSVLSESGVVPRVPPIKCLHAHYAHYRSTVSMDSTKHVNPVGELIHRQLRLDFPDLDL
jgi:hypothetical protein